MAFEDLTSAMHDVIKDTFKEKIPVVYEPLSGGSFPIDGIFNLRHVAVDPDTEQTVSSNQPTLGVKRADMPDVPKNGDKVLIREVFYRIVDSQEDGEGWLHLFLHEV